MTEFIPWTAEQLDRNIAELSAELKKLRRMKVVLYRRQYYHTKLRHDPEFVEASRKQAREQKPRDRKEWWREYGKKTEVKRRNNKRRKTPEFRAKEAEYRNRPIVKLKRKLREAGLDSATIAAEVERFQYQYQGPQR